VISAIDVAESPPKTKISENPMSRPSWRLANHPTTRLGVYHGFPGGWVRVTMKNTMVYSE
jgi:hypothetical protein